MVQEITRKVLVVDDQPDILEAMRLLLKGGGYAARIAGSPEQALAAAATADYDLVLIDMNYARDTTSGAEGLALLDMLHARNPEIPVIVMTAWSTIDLAVASMRRGAADFITKPWDNERVLDVIARQTGVRHEISIARRVQRRLLPQPKVTVPGIVCECVSKPAGDIGGDLCDVFPTGDSSAAFLLGDISGKGTGAALLMASLQATIRSNRELANEPSRLIARANRLFFEATTAEHYATLFFGAYDALSRTLRYVNCGHPAGVLLRQTGEIERLGSTGLVLGAFEDARFEEETVQILRGDRLVLFSDGVSEAQGPADAAPHTGGPHPFSRDPAAVTCATSSEARPAEDDAWAVECVRMLGRAGSIALAESLAMAASESTDDVTVLDLRFD